MTNKVKPFIKWAGGKRQLIKYFKDIFPEKFNVYHEPMIGGGALFFYLNPKRAVINDTNKELMKTYEVIRDNVEELIEKLKLFKSKHSKDFYYKKRNNFNKIKNSKKNNKVELAACLIYLNHTCFNGLYRVNQKGDFNVPVGNYKNPEIFDEKNLKSASNFLKKVDILCDDFETAVKLAKSDDFVYFDPPYDPINNTSNFTEYNNGGFGKKEQKRLCQTFKNLDKKNIKLALSNSNTEFIKNIYRDFNIHVLEAKRTINSNSKKRGKIKELLITNY
jgi:DNA adenine methylase